MRIIAHYISFGTINFVGQRKFSCSFIDYSAITFMKYSLKY